MAAKKDWIQKLQSREDLPQIKKITGKITAKWGNGTMLIPAPREVDQIMKKIPKRKLTTINAIRKILAKKYKTTISCPITTGIFVWIAAHAAEQKREEGKKRVTPYWRTLKTDGFLNPKYPMSIAKQKKLLKEEGHKVVQRGSRFAVVDFQKKLAKIKI